MIYKTTTTTQDIETTYDALQLKVLNILWDIASRYRVKINISIGLKVEFPLRSNVDPRFLCDDLEVYYSNGLHVSTGNRPWLWFDQVSQSDLTLSNLSHFKQLIEEYGIPITSKKIAITKESNIIHGFALAACFESPFRFIYSNLENLYYYIGLEIPQSSDIVPWDGTCHSYEHPTPFTEVKSHLLIELDRQNVYWLTNSSRYYYPTDRKRSKGKITTLKNGPEKLRGGGRS